MASYIKYKGQLYERVDLFGGLFGGKKASKGDESELSSAEIAKVKSAVKDAEGFCKNVEKLASEVSSGLKAFEGALANKEKARQVRRSKIENQLNKLITEVSHNNPMMSGSSFEKAVWEYGLA